MELSSELRLPVPPERVWRVLTDVRRVAACVPGCESVVEEVPLQRYRAVMKQRVGPFRLEVPLEIQVTEAREPERLRARATGRDRATGTAVAADLTIALAGDGDGTRLGITTDLQVGGRLAALGYPMIRKRADETVAEFAARLRAALAEG
jgi:carbon monoxide dehydrogenase subunit G